MRKDGTHRQWYTNNPTQDRPGKFPKSPLLPSHTHTHGLGIEFHVKSGAAEFPRRAAPSFQKPLPKPHPKHQPNRTPQIAITLSLFSFAFGIFQIPLFMLSATDRIEPVPRNHPAAPKVKPDQDSQSLKRLFSLSSHPHHTFSLYLSGSKCSQPGDRPGFTTRYSTLPSPQGKLPRKYVLTYAPWIHGRREAARSLARCGSFVIAGVDPGKQWAPTTYVSSARVSSRHPPYRGLRISNPWDSLCR